MKVAILSKTVCQPTEKVIEFFLQNNFKIDSVIIEMSFRKKFSQREKEYRRKHDKFNFKTKKYPFVRRLARKLWDVTPIFIQKFIIQKIYSIPLLNRFSLRKFCEKRGISVFEVLKHSSEKTKEILERRKIDYVLMVSSNWLLKEPIISMNNTKIINAHSGWLPKHKGLDSIPWALIDNDKVGITTHFVDEGIDSGPILKFYEARIEKGDDFNTIKSKVGSLQPIAFYDTLIGLEENKIIPKLQDNTYKPHTPMSFEMLWDLNKKLIKEKYQPITKPS